MAPVWIADVNAPEALRFIGANEAVNQEQIRRLSRRRCAL
jgi:hypothetical protein